MVTVKHLETEALEAGLDDIRQSPKDEGVLQMIVRRPDTLERETVQEAELDTEQGMVGDNWLARGSSATPDGSAHPEMQLTLMNTRVVDLVSQDKDRWQLAGDQLFVDLDLSMENLPTGAQLSIGSAIVEITEKPHTGCKKFVERFGAEALKFISTPLGKELRLRGVNARVVQNGTVRAGDVARKL